MTAITISETGSLDNIQVANLPIPEIQSNELLIKVAASGINPVDWKGVMGGTFKLPYTLGSDVAGLVVQTGDAITKFKVGDTVMGSLNWTKQGSFAEYVATEEKFIVPVPVNINLGQAAAVPMAALTAWQGLFDHLKIQPTQKILIHAAAGGVGLFALQLSKLAGLYVSVTASEKNRAFLQSLGADEVIDYTKNAILDLPNDFDAVFDSIGLEEASYKILKPGGKYVAISSLGQPLSQKLANQYGVTAKKFLFASNITQLRNINQLIEEYKLKVFIDSSFPLTAAKNALAYQMAGHSRGKNILIIH